MGDRRQGEIEVHRLGERALVFRRRALGFWISATLILTREFNLLVDTLLGSGDMAPVKAALAERGGNRPLFVVNTHFHWDHVWGNGAFAATPILAHRLCREAMAREAAGELARHHPLIPGLGPVDIVLPNVGLPERAVLDGGDAAVELHHAPGHTADAVVVFLPEEGLLVAGDTVEYPFPIAEWEGRVSAFRARLERLATWGIHRVVPGHGPPTAGPELVRANAAYLGRLLDQAEEAARRGLDPEEPAAAIPLRGCLEGWIDPAGWGYEDLHRENVRRAWREAALGGSG